MVTSKRRSLWEHHLAMLCVQGDERQAPDNGSPDLRSQEPVMTSNVTYTWHDLACITGTQVGELLPNEYCSRS